MRADVSIHPFIDHNPAVKINNVSFFANHVVVSEREGGLDYLRVIDMKTNASHRIATTEPDYTLSLAYNPEFNTTTVRFVYQSMVTPSSTFDYDLNTKQRTLLKQQEVLTRHLVQLRGLTTASRARASKGHA